MITEDKTALAVERVLKSKFRRDADDPDAPDVTPYISRRMASDIIAGQFAPQDLTMEGTIHGIMPLAFVPRSSVEQYEAFQDDDDEDRATYISTEAVQARRIKAAAKARASKKLRKHDGRATGSRDDMVPPVPCDMSIRGGTQHFKVVPDSPQRVPEGLDDP
jgi:hypothetical protein